MPNAVRFLLSGNDLHKVVVSSFQVEDALPGAPVGPPGSMVVKFRQYDPGPVQIRPLLPGTIRFIADPGAPGIVPDPVTGSFTEADYADWRTLGRILVTVADRIARELDALAPDLLVKPNRVWYGPVRLPPGFLFETLAIRLKKGMIRTAQGRTIRTTDANWRKYAIAEFLSGRYQPVLETSDDPTQDDRVRFIMPTVEVPADGNIVLVITTALAQKPQDGPDTEFEEPPPAVGREEPLHPRNGLIPAREVYRRLRADMVAEADAAPIADAILTDWPNVRRFLPIRFTRTWEAVPDCSAILPRQTVTIEAGGVVIHQQPLPAHGVLYLPQAPPPAGQPAPAAPTVRVSLAGNTKWLLGGGTSWRNAGTTNAVEIDLAAVAGPHVSVRLPMSQAMFSDRTRPAPGGLRCTYLSLRRSVRALVDNRIAGGRLNFGVRSTSAPTRGIIRRAFDGTPATVGRVADNAPNPLGDPDLALTLEPILQAFFPDDAPQQAIAGPPPAPTIYDQGQMTYRLWQTIVSAFQVNTTKRNFSDGQIGRGAPGAMVAIALAAFQVDPVRNAGESDNLYFNRIAGLMQAGLQPGALLQFWNLDTDFVALKNRAVPGGANPAIGRYGHSPIFVDYVRNNAGVITALGILDQEGESQVSVSGAAGSRRLRWGDSVQQIWIAANWTE